MMALVDNPDQRDWLMEDFENRIGSAIEEFVRWASPVMQFARFVTEDTEINGQPVAAGDKVGLFYCSANRDETVFDDPGAFDLHAHPTRTSASAVAARTSASGNQLAKAELRNLFRELLTRLKTVEFGEPDSAVQQLRSRRQTPAGPCQVTASIGVTMRVEVDLDKCTGHGICESIAEDVFEVQDDGTVQIDEDDRPESDRERMQQAVTQCPAAALRLVD